MFLFLVFNFLDVKNKNTFPYFTTSRPLLLFVSHFARLYLTPLLFFQHRNLMLTITKFFSSSCLTHKKWLPRAHEIVGSIQLMPTDHFLFFVKTRNQRNGFRQYVIKKKNYLCPENVEVNLQKTKKGKKKERKGAKCLFLVPQLNSHRS